MHRRHSQRASSDAFHQTKDQERRYYTTDNKYHWSAHWWRRSVHHLGVWKHDSYLTYGRDYTLIVSNLQQTPNNAFDFSGPMQLLFAADSIDDITGNI